MEDTGPAILHRRKSIAGPFMRSPSGSRIEPIPDGEDNVGRSLSTSTQAVSAPMTIPPPLTRANTVGGWFSGFFSRKTSITSPPTTDSSPLSTFVRSAVHNQDLMRPQENSEDNYAHLASSAPQILPPHSSSRDLLFSSSGAIRPPASNVTQEGNASSPAGNVPPIQRRRSEAAISNIVSSPKKESILSSSPASPPKETDVRQGPGEADLFWLVLRDIGE